MKQLVLVASAVACSQPRSSPPPRETTEVVFHVEGVQPQVQPTVMIEQAPRVLPQPPEVKLRLGHYVNEARGIALTIDRTSELDPRVFRVAKIRFDGTERVIVLDPIPAAGRRLDYLDGRRRVILQVHEDGRIGLWTYDTAGKPLALLALDRDGDAEPLP